MLKFKDITLESIDEIREFLFKQNYGTCDYTVGGIIMWSSYFNYKYCIHDNTFYMMGNDLENENLVSFAMPIGSTNLEKALMLLKEYCSINKLPLVFSGVPEGALEVLKSVFECNIKRLDDWADYIYDSKDMSTFSGKRFHKKKNHVNQFIREYSQFKYERINSSNINRVKESFTEYKKQVSKDSELFKNEEQKVEEVLGNYNKLGFIGGLIEVDGKVAAFSIGEIVNDTLFVHIEKASREYRGVSETLVMYFAKDYADDVIKYVNREEDVGDLGLRKSKESYNPIMLLQKYYVEVQQ